MTWTIDGCRLEDYSNPIRYVINGVNLSAVADKTNKAAGHYLELQYFKGFPEGTEII